jgi:ppGpp synthetase/RelA/SpoT-type nucleotidyltranferase
MRNGCDGGMGEFDKIYKRKRLALERAEAQLRSILQEVVGRIEDRKLVRAEFDAVRPKSLPGLERKARKSGWNAEDAFVRCSDLVGGRIVCNNVEDVYRVEELLKECLPADSGRIERQDYIAQPNERGYRALHLNFRLNVSPTFDCELIPCEIQIRSRLQDAWAELSHADIYKQEELPRDFLDRVKDLANLIMWLPKPSPCVTNSASIPVSERMESGQQHGFTVNARRKYRTVDLVEPARPSGLDCQ